MSKKFDPPPDAGIAEQMNAGDLQSPAVVTAEAPMDADGRVLPPTNEGKRSRKFKLVEIFESVKGEGTQAGIPMVFVRYSKCNLACTWCDTPYNRVAIELTGQQLVDNIIERKPAWVIFTGGEPCLQMDEDVCIALKEVGIKMAVETNGMIWSESLQYMNYINISPKLNEPIHKNWFSTDRKHVDINPDEVRYTICDDQPDIWDPQTGKLMDRPVNDRMTDDVRSLIGLSADFITLSPAMMDAAPQADFKSGEGFRSMHGIVDQASLNRCLYLVNKYRHYNARLSVQVHKFIGAR